MEDDVLHVSAYLQRRRIYEDAKLEGFKSLQAEAGCIYLGPKRKGEPHSHSGFGSLVALTNQRFLWLSPLQKFLLFRVFGTASCTLRHFSHWDADRTRCELNTARYGHTQTAPPLWPSHHHLSTSPKTISQTLASSHVGRIQGSQGHATAAS